MVITIQIFACVGIVCTLLYWGSAVSAESARWSGYVAFAGFAAAIVYLIAMCAVYELQLRVHNRFKTAVLKHGSRAHHYHAGGFIVTVRREGMKLKATIWAPDGSGSYEAGWFSTYVKSVRDGYEYRAGIEHVTVLRELLDGAIRHDNEGSTCRYAIT